MPYPVPYRTSIPGGLYPSKVITVSGIVLQNAKSFYIDLYTGSDIAFRFNPQLDENAVVCNSQIQCVWGPEERTMPSIMPLRRGHSFKVEIICETDHYSVRVNGNHMLNYTHRIRDLRAIGILEVKGDLQNTDVIV